MPTLDEILEQTSQQVTGQPSVAVATPQQEEDKNTVSEAFQYAVDQPLENIGVTLETLGAKDVGEWLREITEAPENYESSTAKFINTQGEGYEWDNFGLALVEQAGQLVGSIASRVAGAGIGGTLGAMSSGPAGAVTGAAVGAFAGPAIFEAIQQLGPIVQERLRRDGREGQEPTWEDWTIAAAGAGASGVLNAIGIKNVGTLNRELAKATIKATTRELGTEATQEVIQEVASGVDTEEGVGKPRDVAKQAFGAGLIGGTSAGGVQATAGAVAKVVKAKEPRVTAVDEFDEKVEAETQRRFDEINPSRLELTDIPKVIEDLGFKTEIAPGESRENVESKLKGFIREQVQREFIREETDKDLLAPLREPTVRAQETKRFNAMTPIELADYIDENIGVDQYTEWVTRQGPWAFDPRFSAENDYKEDREALANAAIRARMGELGLPYQFDPNEYNDYITELTNKYTTQDLRDIAVGYFDVLKRQADFLSARELAQIITDRTLSFRLQQQKTASEFTDKSDYVEIPKGQEDADKFRREIEDDGNAISAVVEMTDENGKTFGVSFERIEAINPLTAEGDPFGAASGALMLSPNQLNPKAKEFVTDLPPHHQSLASFLAVYEGELRSLELPIGTLPQFGDRPIDKIARVANTWYRPYGEVGLEVGRRQRENIGRQRALNENAKDIAREYEEAVVTAYKNGELDAEPTTLLEQAQAKIGVMPKDLRADVDRLAMAFLRNTGARIKLNEEQKAAYEKEIARLEQDLLLETTEEGQKSVQEDIDEYTRALSGIQKTAVAAEQLPKSIRKPMIRIRESIDSLSKRILDLPNLTDEEKVTIQEGINRYVTRSFAIFEPGLGWNPKFSKDWLRNKETQELYNRAITSLMSINKDRPNYTEAKAKQTIDRILKLEQMESSRDFARLPAIFQSTENRVDLDVPSKLLQSRGVIPYPIRKLMGEIDDPALVASTSLQRLSRLVEQAEFFNDLSQINQRPGEMLFSPEPMGRYNVPIAENDFNPLSGMFTTKQIAEAVGEEIETPNSAKDVLFSIYDAAFLLPKSLTQMGIIILSPATQSRNFLGGGIMFMANGYAGNNGLDTALKNIKHNLFGNLSYENGELTVEGREAQRNFKRMQDLGVVNTNVRLNDAADLFARISSRSSSTVGRMSHALQTLKQTPPGKVVDKTVGSVLRGAQATYAATDDFWKMAAFEADRIRLRNMLSDIQVKDDRTEQLANLEQELERDPTNNFLNAQVQDLRQNIEATPTLSSKGAQLKVLRAYAETLTTKIGTDYKSNLAKVIRTTDLDEYIDEVAAYHVRMGMPNYDYVGKFAQVIRQIPFGNFIAFPTEILRTAVGNLPQIAYKQMTFRIPDEVMAEENIVPHRPLIKQEDGSTVLGNPMAPIPFITGGIKRVVLGGAAVYGLGATLQALGQFLFDVEDEDLEAVRATQPEYAENSRLMPLSEIKDGKGEFINLDYILPYEGFSSIAESVFRSIHEGEYEGQAIPTSVAQGLVEWVIDYTGSYTDAAISSRVQAELVMNLDFDTNKAIYNPEDNWGDIVESMFDHVINNAAPGAVSQFRDVYKSLQEGEDRYDKYLRDKEVQLAFAKLMGIATTEMDAATSFGFKINAYKRLLENNIEKNMQNLAYDARKLTEKDILSEWRDAQEIWFRAQQALYFDIQSFKKVGMSDKVLREQLKRLKAVPGVDPQFFLKIKKGIFTPWKPPAYIKKAFNKTKKELQQKQREQGLDPAAITRTWPTTELRDRHFELRNKDYNLTAYPSLPPLED